MGEGKQLQPKNNQKKMTTAQVLDVSNGLDWPVWFREMGWWRMTDR